MWFNFWRSLRGSERKELRNLREQVELAKATLCLDPGLGFEDGVEQLAEDIRQLTVSVEKLRVQTAALQAAHDKSEAAAAAKLQSFNDLLMSKVESLTDENTRLICRADSLEKDRRLTLQANKNLRARARSAEDDLEALRRGRGVGVVS